MDGKQIHTLNSLLLSENLLCHLWNDWLYDFVYLDLHLDCVLKVRLDHDAAEISFELAESDSIATAFWWVLLSMQGIERLHLDTLTTGKLLVHYHALKQRNQLLNQLNVFT